MIWFATTHPPEEEGVCIVWPDLAKNVQVGQNIKILWLYWKGLFGIWQTFTILWLYYKGLFGIRRSHLGTNLKSFGYICKVLLGNWRSHFGKNLQSFGNIKKVYLVYGKVLNQLWHNFFALWQIFIDVLNGRMQKTIWSHWVRVLVCGIGLVSINFLRRHFKCWW